MRMIGLLIALVIVGLLIYQQLGKVNTGQTQTTVAGGNAEVPKVPTRPQDIQNFEQDINKFVNDTAVDRARQLEQGTQ